MINIYTYIIASYLWYTLRIGYINFLGFIKPDGKGITIQIFH
jgi:hypothetical protein